MAELDAEKVRREVEAVLSEVRPGLEEHGGGAELVAVEGKKVVLELKGACHGCALSSFTFGIMVDEMIKERLPEIEEIEYE